MPKIETITIITTGVLDIPYSNYITEFRANVSYILMLTFLSLALFLTVVSAAHATEMADETSEASASLSTASLGESTAVGAVGEVGAVGAVGAVGEVGAVGAVGEVGEVGEVSNTRAIFDAWQQWDTDTLATDALGKMAIPSRSPIDKLLLSSSFGMRRHPITKRFARHAGIDIPAPHGTPIYAAADGVVARAKQLGSYGNLVEIEHGNAIQTRYGHMSALNVTSGQWVRKGDVVGFVGSTGRSTGNHLHYEVRISGVAVDPMPFVQETSMANLTRNAPQEAMGGPNE